MVGIAGYYIPQQETKVNYNGREVLYTAGQVNLEASCCSVSDWDYILVDVVLTNTCVDLFGEDDFNRNSVPDWWEGLHFGYEAGVGFGGGDALEPDVPLDALPTGGEAEWQLIVAPAKGGGKGKGKGRGRSRGGQRRRKKQPSRS